MLFWGNDNPGEFRAFRRQWHSMTVEGCWMMPVALNDRVSAPLNDNSREWQGGDAIVELVICGYPWGRFPMSREWQNEWTERVFCLCEDVMGMVIFWVFDVCLWWVGVHELMNSRIFWVDWNGKSQLCVSWRQVVLRFGGFSCLRGGSRVLVFLFG